MELTSEQKRRYNRHLILDGIGKEKAKAYYNTDHTHTSKLGAQNNAQSLAKGLRAQNHPLAKYLK